MEVCWENINKDAVVILRVSTQKQNMDSQEKEVLKYCREKVLNVTRVFKIKESAKISSKRKQYLSAIEYAKQNSVLHVVFFMQDREARNLRDVEDNLDLVRDGKIVLHYALERQVLHKDSADSEFMMREMKATYDKNFSRTLSTRSKFSMRCKAENGWYPGNKPPMGYKIEKTFDEFGNERKRGAIVVPAEGELELKLVQREFELRAESYSVAEIRRIVIDENLVPYKRRNRYSKSGIEGRLKKKFYRGSFDWDGTEYKGNHKLVIPSHILSIVDKSFI